MTKYKIGDRVKIILNLSDNKKYDKTVGKTGWIEDILDFGEFNLSIFSGKKGSGKFIIRCKPEEIQLLPKKHTKKVVKYGEPCPKCGLSWMHGGVSCKYPYPSKTTKKVEKIECKHKWQIFNTQPTIIYTNGMNGAGGASTSSLIAVCTKCLEKKYI
jgi:ribosomal protein L21E